MKRILRFVAVLLIVITVAMLALTVAAQNSDPAVLYDGTSKEFVFENAVPFGDNTEPDLFTSLKDMMPGDAAKQDITVGVRRAGMNSVRLHLRAENPNEDYVKLMEEYGHWITFTVKNGDTEITGNLDEGVVLGSFSWDERTTVSVELAVDIEAGNELQAMVAEIDWVFTAEIIPGTTGLPDPDVDLSDLPWLTDAHINYIIGYEDNTVRPDASITRAEVATIFFRLLKDEIRDQWWSTESKYPDVESDDWFYIAVCTLTNGGILEGYPDGTFCPNDPITRAELAAIICRFDSKFGQLDITQQFDDAEGHWAEDYIEFAATRRYVIGYEDGTFRPDRDITRAETVTMVNRCLKRAVDEKGLIPGYLNWPDNRKNTWYYFEIIEAANYHSYERSDRLTQTEAFHYENWLHLHELIDWAVVEQEWIKIHTGQ